MQPLTLLGMWLLIPDEKLIHVRERGPGHSNDEVKCIRVLLFNHLLQAGVPKHYGSQFCWCHMYLNYRRHNDVIKWRHFPRHWPFVRGIQRSPVNSPHKGRWCEALMFSLICAWINVRVNNREAGDSRRHNAYYDVTVMKSILPGSGINT